MTSPFNYSTLTLEELRTLAASPQVGAIEAMPHAFRHLATQVGEVADLLSRAQADLPNWWKGPAADQAAAALGRAAAEAHEFHGSAQAAAAAVSRCATIVAEQQHQMMNVPELPEPGVTAIIERPKTPMEALEAARQDAAYQAARERAVQVVNGIAAQYVETREHLAVIGTPRGDNFRPAENEASRPSIADEALQRQATAKGAGLENDQQHSKETAFEPATELMLKNERLNYPDDPLATRVAMPEASYEPSSKSVNERSNRATIHQRDQLAREVEFAPSYSPRPIEVSGIPHFRLSPPAHSSNHETNGASRQFEVRQYDVGERVEPQQHWQAGEGGGASTHRPQETPTKDVVSDGQQIAPRGVDEMSELTLAEPAATVKATGETMDIDSLQPNLPHNQMSERGVIPRREEGRRPYRRGEEFSISPDAFGPPTTPSLENEHRSARNESSGANASPLLPPISGSGPIRRQREDRNPRPAYLKEQKNVWQPDTIAAPADGIITPEWFEQQ